VHLLGEGLYCIGVGKVIEGTVLSEGITTFQCTQDQVFPLLRVDLSGERQRLGLRV
jgi:hypothetical protein